MVNIIFMGLFAEINRVTSRKRLQVSNRIAPFPDSLSPESSRTFESAQGACGYECVFGTVQLAVKLCKLVLHVLFHWVARQRRSIPSYFTDDGAEAQRG